MIAGASRPVPDSELADRIVAGANALATPLVTAQVAALVAYIRLVERWNATYNLTAVRDPVAMVSHHVLDCLAASAALRRRRGLEARRRLIDVGSGAGLPGLVIAVALPETAVVCVDSVGKKSAFVAQAAATIGVANLTAVHARAERFLGERFNVVVSRAFASLPEFVASTRHLLADNGEWMAMKGKVPTEEIAALTDTSADVERLVVPGLDAERCIVWIRPTLTR